MVEGFTDHEGSGGVTERMDRDVALLRLAPHEQPDAGTDQADRSDPGVVAICEIAKRRRAAWPIKADDAAGEVVGRQSGLNKLVAPIDFRDADVVAVDKEQDVAGRPA